MATTRMVRLVSERHGDGHTLWRVEIQIDGAFVDATPFYDNPMTAHMAGVELARLYPHAEDPVAA